MTHNSKKAWKTIINLNSDQEPDQHTAAVTPNQVAKQLLDNGKPHNKECSYVERMKEEISRVLEENNKIFFPFCRGKLLAGLKHLKVAKHQDLMELVLR